MSELIETPGDPAEDGSDDVGPALVQIDSETALVFGDATSLGLDVQPLIFDFDASAIGERLVQATGLANAGVQALDGYNKAQGLVRLAPETLEALKTAKPLVKDGWNLGTLMKDGKFAQQIRWAPAGGAGAVGVLAALGPAAALIAIQWQLGKIAAAVEHNIELTSEVMERLRAEQWAEVHGVRKVVLEVLDDARHVGEVGAGSWAKVQSHQPLLEKHRKLFDDATRRHIRKVDALASLEERRRWFRENGSAVLMDAASLISAQEAWFVYQGLHAAHLLRDPVPDAKDERLAQHVIARTDTEHRRVSQEISRLLDQLERVFGELEESPGRVVLPFGKSKRTAKDVRRMSRQLREHIARVRGATFIPEPPVPGPIPLVALADDEREELIRRKIRWHLALNEDVHATADAILYVKGDGKRSVQVLTDQRLLVVGSDLRNEIDILREIPRDEIRFVRVIEGPEARKSALEVRIAAVSDELTLAFPEWARDEENRGPARRFAHTLQSSMSLPGNEVPPNPIPRLGTTARELG